MCSGATLAWKVRAVSRRLFPVLSSAGTPLSGCLVCVSGRWPTAGLWKRTRCLCAGLRIHLGSKAAARAPAYTLPSLARIWPAVILLFPCSAVRCLVATSLQLPRVLWVSCCGGVLVVSAFAKIPSLCKCEYTKPLLETVQGLLVAVCECYTAFVCPLVCWDLALYQHNFSTFSYEHNSAARVVVLEYAASCWNCPKTIQGTAGFLHVSEKNCSIQCL